MFMVMDVDIFTPGYVPTASRVNNQETASLNFQKAKNCNITFERVVGKSTPSQKPILLFLPGLDGQGEYSLNVRS